MGNTSFNIRGEPIVRALEDEFRCFMGTEMGLLVMGPHGRAKSQPSPALQSDYRTPHAAN